MPRSEVSQYKDRLKSILGSGKRFVNTAIQFRIYDRNDKDEAVPAETFGPVIGGLYDRAARRYVGPGTPREIKIHRGQAELLAPDRDGEFRRVYIGAPGSGKTYGLILAIMAYICARPNTTIGVVTPVADQKSTVWRDFLRFAMPKGLVAKDGISKSTGEITTLNNVLVQFVSAQKQSGSESSPIQGRSWARAFVDESQSVDADAHDEIMARGRRAAKTFRIYEAATFKGGAGFRLRYEQLKLNSQVTIIKAPILSNSFVSNTWKEKLRANYSTEAEFLREVMCEDVPLEKLTYPQFDFKTSIAPIPTVGIDMTARLIERYYGIPNVKYLVGWDPGRLTSASIVLKAYQLPGRHEDGMPDRAWYAVNEITVGNHGSASAMALQLIDRYPVEDMLVVADPHLNGPSDLDPKSDYALLQREGLRLMPAAFGKIGRSARISMVNTLLCDSQGNRRLFVACDQDRRPRCQRLAQSFLLSELDDWGRPEMQRKDEHDMSHWTAAMAYALWKIESIRNRQPVRFIAN